jgi:hypothetical protein
MGACCGEQSMKRISVVLGLLAAGYLSIGLVGCGKNNGLTTGSEVKGPSPKITFEKEVYDFGEVGVNTKRTDQIKFSNTGDALLKITHIEGCCGVNVKLDKKELGPGETGILEMEWTAKRIPTTMMWRLVVQSNDRANPEVILTMMAKLVQRVACDPPRLRLCLDKENAGCPKLTIRSLDKRPFSIKGIKSTADCITADFDPSKEATEFVLEPKVSMEKLQQNLQGRIGFELTHPEGREIAVLFDVLPKYTLNPQLLIVLEAMPGRPMVRKIKVTGNFGESPDVKSVSSKDGTFAVKLLGEKVIDGGREIEVEITPLAPVVEGKTVYTGTLSITLESDEELPITCNAYYTARRIKAKSQSEAM